MRIPLSVLLCTLLPVAALAQRQWDRSYTVGSRPALQLEADDAAVDVHSCGGCQAVHIHIDARDADLSDYRIEDRAVGPVIHLQMKQKTAHSWFNWKHGKSPKITIDLPGGSDADVNTGNGDVEVAGVHGGVRLHSGNGNMTASGTSGTLRLNTGNGNVVVRESEGTLESSTGNGNVDANGRFSQLEAHTGNGKVDVALAAGTRLNAASHLGSGNGAISLRVPRELQADLELSSGLGSVHCDLPLTGNGAGEGSHMEGKLNGGGPPIRLEAGLGSIHVGAL